MYGHLGGSSVFLDFDILQLSSVFRFGHNTLSILDFVPSISITIQHGVFPWPSIASYALEVMSYWNPGHSSFSNTLDIFL